VTGRNELHVLDVSDGSLDQWSAGTVPRNVHWYVRWAADGGRVFFHRDEAGDEQNDVCALAPDGAATAVAQSDGQNVLQDVGGDGETLLVGSNRDGQMNVYRHDLPAGETAKLTDYDRAVWGAVLAPDCDRFAYATNETDDFDNRDVYVANADGSGARNLELGEVGAECHPADWGPDGERLLVEDNTPDLGRVGVYDCRDGDVRWYGDGEFEESPVAVLPGGEQALATRIRGPATVPVVYNLESGERRELALPEGVASFGGWYHRTVPLDEDRILVEHTTPTRRPELLAYDLGADEYGTLLAADHGRFEPDDFADAEYSSWKCSGAVWSGTG